MAELTPMMRQYLEIKERRNGTRTASCFSVWAIFMKCLPTMPSLLPMSLT